MTEYVFHLLWDTGAAQLRAQQRRVLHRLENKGREALRQVGARGAVLARTEKQIISIKDAVMFKSESSVLHPGWKQVSEDFLPLVPYWMLYVKIGFALAFDRCIFQDSVTAKPSILECQNLWSEQGMALDYTKSKRCIRICFNNPHTKVYFCDCFTTADTFD